MNNKIKKILTTSLVSAMTITTLSAGVANLSKANIAETAKANIMQNENLINSKDNVANRNKIGKIVETSLLSDDGFKTYTRSNGATYLTDTNDSSQTNTNTSESSMGVFILSESPYITLSNDSNGSRLSMYINFSKDAFRLNPIYHSQNIDSAYCLKKSILMMYTNELYNGNITLSAEKQTELENLLNNSAGQSMNDYIDSVIDILESGLNENSTYYGKNLSSLSDTIKSTSQSASGQYKTLADKILSAFKLQDNLSANNTSQQNSTDNNSNSSIAQNDTTYNRRRLISNNDNKNLAQINQNNTSSNTNQTTDNQNNSHQTNNIAQNSYNTQNRYNQTNTNNSDSNMTNQNRRNTSNRRNYYNRQSLNNYNQNQTGSESSTNLTEQNQSSHRTMRADRTPTNDYISGKPSFQNSNRPRASRTPYNNQMTR